MITTVKSPVLSGKIVWEMNNEIKDMIAPRINVFKGSFNASFVSISLSKTILPKYIWVEYYKLVNGKMPGWQNLANALDSSTMMNPEVSD